MVPNFEPDDVFEPSHYGGVRRRWDTAKTLSGRCYTSPRFYQRERERIFFRYWNCIGHQSRVPEPGSYLAFDFMGVQWSPTLTRATERSECRLPGATLCCGRRSRGGDGGQDVPKDSSLRHADGKF